MVAEDAAKDAVQRAKTLPQLGVGLHLTLISGAPLSPKEVVSKLMTKDGRFSDNMVTAGINYFFSAKARHQLRGEIKAQFEAFKATGLPLDHVNTHRHFHLHPTLTSLILEIGSDYGMKAMRLPYEPRQGDESFPPLTTRLYEPWVRHLGRRLKKRNILTNDSVFGLRFTGEMTEGKLLARILSLPKGLTEIYLHPAVKRSEKLKALMPNYLHTEEFAALVSPRVAKAVFDRAITLTTYSKIAGRS